MTGDGHIPKPFDARTSSRVGSSRGEGKPRSSSSRRYLSSHCSRSSRLSGSSSPERSCRLATGGGREPGARRRFGDFPGRGAVVEDSCGRTGSTNVLSERTTDGATSVARVDKDMERMGAEDVARKGSACSSMSSSSSIIFTRPESSAARFEIQIGRLCCGDSGALTNAVLELVEPLAPPKGSRMLLSSSLTDSCSSLLLRYHNAIATRIISPRRMGTTTAATGKTSLVWTTSYPRGGAEGEESRLVARYSEGVKTIVVTAG